MTARHWLLIDSGPNTAAVNMALDEQLLARAQTGETMPVLRFYTWSPPAVSLGRFQDIRDAVDADACKLLGFDIIRRVTGGRAVLHHRELTYSIISRTDNPLFPPSVSGAYQVIAAGLLKGLHNLGIAADMVSRGGRHAHLVEHKTKTAACFSSPSWYEILAGGRKIVGSAQRRLSHAFLQHGSILLDYDPELEARVIPGGPPPGDVVTSLRRELGSTVPLPDIKEAFAKGFSETLGIPGFSREP